MRSARRRRRCGFPARTTPRRSGRSARLTTHWARPSSISCTIRADNSEKQLMKIVMIGAGAIGSWLQERLDPKPVVVRRGDALPMTDVVVEVAGHVALAQYGVAALQQGSD